MKHPFLLLFVFITLLQAITSAQTSYYVTSKDGAKIFVQEFGKGVPVKLLAGVDPTGDGRVIPGYADRIVPELLVQVSFALPQTIKICSLNASGYLGKEKETGSIAVGKNADLVLINGDIEADIKNMRNIEIVFKNGIGWDSQKIFDSVKGLVGLY